jgi:hypothetical protein
MWTLRSIPATGLPTLVVGLGLAACVDWDASGQATGCRSQATSFTSAGDGFLRPSANWSRWASPAAQPAPQALGAALDAENAEIEALQIAFDALLYCRWIEARTVRADIAARRVSPEQGRTRMTALRAQVTHDLTRAQEVLAGLERRAAGREVTLEAAVPGTRAAAESTRGERGRVMRVVAAATVTLRLRPELGAPEIGRVAAGDAVTLRPAGSGFALVERSGTTRGYAPIGAFQIAERVPAGTAAAMPDGEVRRLAGTNIARRDNFAESIALAAQAAETGFELAS